MEQHIHIHLPPNSVVKRVVDGNSEVTTIMTFDSAGSMMDYACLDPFVIVNVEERDVQLPT